MFIVEVAKEIVDKFRQSRTLPEPVSLKKKVPEALKRSLKLRVIDAGDDEGLMAELYALEGPAYSVQSYGVDFVASPKHADGVVIVGCISQNMQQAVRDTYEVIQEPKVVIALGDKAIHGDPRFTNCLSAKEVLGHVDLEIAGNPPHAKAILSHLVAFLK